MFVIRLQDCYFKLFLLTLDLYERLILNESPDPEDFKIFEKVWNFKDLTKLEEERVGEEFMIERRKQYSSASKVQKKAIEYLIQKTLLECLIKHIQTAGEPIPRLVADHAFKLHAKVNQCYNYEIKKIVLMSDGSMKIALLCLLSAAIIAGMVYVDVKINDGNKENMIGLILIPILGVSTGKEIPRKILFEEPPALPAELVKYQESKADSAPKKTLEKPPVSKLPVRSKQKKEPSKLGRFIKGLPGGIYQVLAIAGSCLKSVFCCGGNKKPYDIKAVDLMAEQMMDLGNKKIEKKPVVVEEKIMPKKRRSRPKKAATNIVKALEEPVSEQLGDNDEPPAFAGTEPSPLELPASQVLDPPVLTLEDKGEQLEQEQEQEIQLATPAVQADSPRLPFERFGFGQLSGAHNFNFGGLHHSQNVSQQFPLPGLRV